MIDIKGIDKVKLLQALYNNAKVQGLGAIHYIHGDMTTGYARTLIQDGRMYFDYLHGRAMKVRISGDSIDPRGYDMDNGEGAAERAISHLLGEKS